MENEEFGLSVEYREGATPEDMEAATPFVKQVMERLLDEKGVPDVIDRITVKRIWKR